MFNKCASYHHVGEIYFVFSLFVNLHQLETNGTATSANAGHPDELHLSSMRAMPNRQRIPTITSRRTDSGRGGNGWEGNVVMKASRSEAASISVVIFLLVYTLTNVIEASAQI